jgi:hypothetical protein
MVCVWTRRGKKVFELFTRKKSEREYKRFNFFLKVSIKQQLQLHLLQDK